MLRILFIDTFITPVGKKKWLWAIYLSLWIVDFLFLRSMQSAQILFLLFALIVFTIPHGVCDFYLPAWILNPPWEQRVTYWIATLGIFGGFAALIWLTSQISIDFVIALYVGLIIWHWGSMDTVDIYPRKDVSWVIGSIGRGLLVLIAPIYFKPMETREFILEILHVEQNHILTTLYSLSHYLIIIAVGLEIMAFLTNKFVEGNGLPQGMAAHATETLLLLITFKLASPLVSLSFYFLILHPFRHLCRAIDYIPEERGQMLDTGGLLKTLPSLFQRTNLVTFLAGFILTAWFVWQLSTGSSFRQAALGCLTPVILLMISHTLVSMLTDFNPKRLED
jgi:Brp/Blh family beta-carotene 15,15'-monooxygenase